MNTKAKGINKKYLKLLYRSFDWELEENEQKQLAEALENSEELRKEKDHISAQRRAVSESRVQFFKPFFSERVMKRIHSKVKINGLGSFYESMKALFQRLAIAGAIITIVLISYNLWKGNSLTAEEIFYTSDETFEEILQMPLF